MTVFGLNLASIVYIEQLFIFLLTKFIAHVIQQFKKATGGVSGGRILLAEANDFKRAVL